jgi:hypothetical protein
MSLKKLLNDDQLILLYQEYHSYIANCKRNGLDAELNGFFTHLKKRHDQFKKFTRKQLSNQIIASRRQYGNLLWPNLNDLTNYISPTARTFIEKSVKSALLAVEIYNKPAIDYRTEGYIVMMNIAWTSLFHAIFANSSKNYKYKNKNSLEEKYFEIGKCLTVYQGLLKKEIEANLNFLIDLRDLIEHRIIPDLDDEVFGECQACLFNYEKILSENFGNNYQINNSLAYSLQFSKKYSSAQLKAKRKYDLSNYLTINKFIEQYRSNLDPEIFQSIHYSFRVFMIPKVGNHIESSDLAVEFIKYDPSKKQEYDSYEKLLYVIRDKRVPGEYFKAGEVSKQIYEKLKDSYRENWKFSASYHHAKCAKYFKIKEGHYTGNPDKTNAKYCIYDWTFNQHIYTKEWVVFLTEKLKDKELFKKIIGSN